MSDRERIIDTMEEAFASVEELCASLDAADWARPTDCPGWSVQDQLAHLCGIEASLLGRPAPQHEPAHAGRGNEVPVDYRRSWAPDKVLAEWRELAAERMKQLRAMSDEEFTKEGFSPTGRGGYAEFMAVRIFDCWFHEQDIRTATSRPGRLDGPVAEHSLGRCTGALPMIVGKRVAPPEGACIVFDIAGVGVFPIGVKDGRAARLDAEPPDPIVRLTMDAHAFNRLCGGRQTAEQLGDRVQTRGDQQVAARVLASMTLTP